MKKAYIKRIEFYVPDNLVTNEDLVQEFPEWSVDKIASKVGVVQRYVAGKNETSADMAIKAAEKLFRNDNVNKEDIDYVLFCTQSPDYLLPTSACIIQDKLGLNKNIGALDFNLGCSGYVYGLSLAKGLLYAGIAKNILLLTGECYNKHLHPRDKGNRTIFGDAASATIISTDGIAEILDFSLGTDGSGAENLIIKSGGARQPEKVNDAILDENGNPFSSDHIFMDGSEIFAFTLDAVPFLINDTLSKNNLIKDDINLFVFHQANKFMLDFLRKKIKIEKEKFYHCLANYGNTVSSTIPIALYHAMNDNSIAKDDKVLIAGFGVGYSWGGVILKF